MFSNYFSDRRKNRRTENTHCLLEESVQPKYRPVLTYQDTRSQMLNEQRQKMSMQSDDENEHTSCSCIHCVRRACTAFTQLA